MGIVDKNNTKLLEPTGLSQTIYLQKWESQTDI